MNTKRLCRMSPALLGVALKNLIRLAIDHRRFPQIEPAA
jgi:hypothetical protein